MEGLLLEKGKLEITSDKLRVSIIHSLPPNINQNNKITPLSK